MGSRETRDTQDEPAEPAAELGGADGPTVSLSARVAGGSLPEEVDGPIEDRPTDASQGYTPGAGGGRVDAAAATYGADDDRDESAASGGPVTSVGGGDGPESGLA
jgi:hypothetical protein